MSIQINITVGGADLVAQARRQQEGNRWRLEERDRQQGIDAAAAQRAGQADTGSGLPSGRAPGGVFRPDELAAFRRSNDAFLVIGNNNREPDDSFDVYIDTPVTGNFIKQDGNADFSEFGMIYYLWTAKGITAEQFTQTKGGRALVEYVLDVHPSQQIIWRNANRLRGVKIGRRQGYALKLIVTKANNNANYGQIYTGFTNVERFGLDEFSDDSLSVGDEVAITQRNELWGDPLP